MTTSLLVIVIALDVLIVGIVIAVVRSRGSGIEILEQLTEERQVLLELRKSIQEELSFAQSRSKEILSQVSHLAAEAEREVKAGSETLTTEIENIIQQLSPKFSDPLKDLARKQVAMEKLLRRVDQEKTLLQKSVRQAEQLYRLFQSKTPYDEVVRELDEKKYADARQLLTQGIGEHAVAKELDLSLSEVRLLSGTSLA